jgi:hypothetical protein
MFGFQAKNKLLEALMTLITYLAHRAAAQGNIDLLVHAVKCDPGVLEQDDGEGI